MHKGMQAKFRMFLNQYTSLRQEVIPFSKKHCLHQCSQEVKAWLQKGFYSFWS